MNGKLWIKWMFDGQIAIKAKKLYNFSKIFVQVSCDQVGGMGG